MSRSSSLEKKNTPGSSPSQGKQTLATLNQESIKNIQVSLQEMLTPLSANITILTD